MDTTTQAQGQPAMPFDPHHDEKEAFSSLYLFADLPSGHVQVEPVSRCHLANPAPPSKPPKPGKAKFKQPKPLTVGCPVDVDGFPLDDPRSHPVAPAFQPQAGSPTQATKARAARFQITVTFGGKL